MVDWLPADFACMQSVSSTACFGFNPGGVGRALAACSHDDGVKFEIEHAPIGDLYDAYCDLTG